ncbi:MAG: HAMP domain-containing histidine kinase [Rhodospirillaceae bacterium]|nr:HAMP domain-containing histidine kinase [Rhodospirillales bacterium]
MQALSQMIVGRPIFVVSAIFLALAAALMGVLPHYVAALLAVAAVMAFLVWEVVVSRRQLIQEHAAHMAKSAYLANMSHELRTPLNAIIGYSEMIRDEMVGPLGTPKYGEFAGDIHASGTHLLELINDVLELSRIEAGRLELHERSIHLAPVLVSCQRLLGDQARRAGLQLDIHSASDLPEIFCDATKIKQVVLNLMTNAVKFTPDGGKVSVRAYRKGGAVGITVTDTGIGIPANEISRVLTPFLQAAHTHLMSDQGTGLGLPLAKKLIELHGGTLALDSKPGEGTRVTVLFPAERCRPAAARAESFRAVSVGA